MRRSSYKKYNLKKYKKYDKYKADHNRGLFNFYKPETAAQWVIFIAAMGMAAPMSPKGGLLDAICMCIEHYSEKSAAMKPRSLSQAVYYLKKRKAISIKEVDGEIKIVLKERGRKMVLQYRWNGLEVSKPSKWDGRWRMLMFDIPKGHEMARKALRRKLKGIGFLQFQKSVWIYPYPCEAEIDFISEYLEIAPYVNLIAVRIDKDGELRKAFKM